MVPTPNVRDAEHDETMLCWAMSAGLDEIAEVLLAHGADINAVTREGRSILAVTSCWDEKTARISPLYQRLLELGTDVNIIDEDGRTALHWQVNRTQPASAIRLLLDYGANPHLADEDGETARDIADNSGFIELVEVLRLAEEA